MLDFLGKRSPHLKHQIFCNEKVKGHLKMAQDGEESRKGSSGFSDRMSSLLSAIDTAVGGSEGGKKASNEE